MNVERGGGSLSFTNNKITDYCWYEHVIPVAGWLFGIWFFFPSHIT